MAAGEATIAELRLVDAAQFLRIGKHLDQVLARLGDVEVGVGAGLDVAEPGAEHEEHVGVPHPSR